MNAMKALLKREFLENKVSFLYTPLAIAGLILFLIIVETITLSNSFHTSGIQKLMEKGDEIITAGIQTMLQLPIILFGLVLFGVTLSYTLNSLYEDRKDKSILFWKSLPVSDISTILYKVASLLIMMPVIYFVIASVFQLVLLLYMSFQAWLADLSGFKLIANSNFFGMLFNNLMGFIVANLWMLPFWSWIMLTSAWAKKSVFLFTLLPFLFIAYVENWLFDTSDFAEMIGQHLASGFGILNSNIKHIADHSKVHELDIEIMTVWSDVFGQSDFWIGMLVSAVFLTGAIYTRRIKNEL
ncbi:MAG: hypothetical protein OEY96_05040 [Gammaproteobacteria bacterium]|nr:hypothetical protein [Gammaproteobacteria bacterium]